MKKLQQMIAMLMAVSMLLALAACGDSGSKETNSPGTTGPGETATDGEKELVIGYLGGYTTFCPSTGISDVSDALTNRLVYDQLFEVNDKTMETESRILESEEWLDDYTYKLVLKQGITYADGSEMIGEDILNSLKMYVENNFTEIGMYQVIDFDQSYVEDTYTVYLVYSEVNAAAVTRLSVPIIDKDFYDAHPDGDDIWWTGDVNGSGPYTVTDYALDEYLVLEKRADYWDSSADYDADKITIQFYTDGSALVADLENGQVDLALNLDTTDMDTLEATKGENIVVDTISTYDVTKLMFNNYMEEMTDLNLRKAVVHGVDWAEVASAAYGNLGAAATSHWTEGYDCYAAHEGYGYDPEYAAECLAAAGYESGQLTLKFLASDSMQAAAGEVMQAYLDAIGINLVVDQMELAKAFDYYMSAEEYAMIINAKPGGNPSRDPYDDGALPTSSLTINHILDSAYSEMMTSANGTLDDDARASLYAEIDDWLYDNYQMIPVAETLQGYAYNSDCITDITICSFGRGNLASIELS